VNSNINHNIKLALPFPNYVSFSSEFAITSTPDYSISLIWLQLVLSTKWISLKHVSKGKFMTNDTSVRLELLFNKY